MSVPITYSLLRYLAAKKSVDDRALNWQVWQHLVAALPRATPQQPLRILEVGAGIGTMVERLVAGDVLTHATYTAIDRVPALWRKPTAASANGLTSGGLRWTRTASDSCMCGERSSTSR